MKDLQQLLNDGLATEVTERDLKYISNEVERICPNCLVHKAQINKLLVKESDVTCLTCGYFKANSHESIGEDYE